MNGESTQYVSFPLFCVWTSVFDSCSMSGLVSCKVLDMHIILDRYLMGLNLTRFYVIDFRLVSRIFGNKVSQTKFDDDDDDDTSFLDIKTHQMKQLPLFKNQEWGKGYTGHTQTHTPLVSWLHLVLCAVSSVLGRLLPQIWPLCLAGFALMLQFHLLLPPHVILAAIKITMPSTCSRHVSPRCDHQVTVYYMCLMFDWLSPVTADRVPHVFLVLVSSAEICI